MQVTFRLLIFALVGFGLAVGVSFGLGVAYGKGDPKTVNSGLTQQQIQALIGGSGGSGGAGGAQNTPRAAAGTGTDGTSNTTGQITAVDNQSVTLQTAQSASVKVTLGGNTTIQTLTTGKASDLKVGDTVIISGTRGADGSVAATSISSLPAAVQSLLGGGVGQQRMGATP